MMIYTVKLQEKTTKYTTSIMKTQALHFKSSEVILSFADWFAVISLFEKLLFKKFSASTKNLSVEMFLKNNIFLSFSLSFK